MDKIEIKPSRKYFIIGISGLGVMSFFVMWSFYMQEKMMIVLCSSILLPMLSCFSICFLLPYYKKRIIIEKEKIIINSPLGRKRVIDVDEITEVKISKLLDSVEVFVGKKNFFMYLAHMITILSFYVT